MGLPSVEELSNVLIKAGAKRIVKDLVRNISIFVVTNDRRFSGNDRCLEFPEITATLLLFHEQIGYRETSRRRGKFRQVDRSDDADRCCVLCNRSLTPLNTWLKCMTSVIHTSTSSCVCIRIVVFHWSPKFFFSKYAWRDEQVESTRLTPCKSYDYVTNLRHVIYSTLLFSINNTNNKSIQFSPYTFLSITFAQLLLLRSSFFVLLSLPYHLRTFNYIDLTHLNIDR